WPITTYSTDSPEIPAFSSAPRIAIAPRSDPDNVLRPPMSLPTGVRAPATITDSGMRTPLARVTPIVLAADSRRVTPGCPAFIHPLFFTRQQALGHTAHAVRRRCRGESAVGWNSCIIS